MASLPWHLRRAGRGALAVALIAAAARADAGVLPEWHVESVRSDLLVLSMASTPDGYLWAAAQGVVFRYDGFRHQSIAEEVVPEVPGPAFRVAAEENGDVWVAFGPGVVDPHAYDKTVERLATERTVGVVRFRGGRWRRLQRWDTVAEEATWAILPDRAGGLLLATAGGLKRLREGKLETIADAARLGGAARALAWKGAAVVVGTDSGIAVVQATSTSPAVAATPLGRAVDAVAVDAAGTVWAGTKAGLFALEPSATVRRWGAADGVPDGDVRALAVDAEGAVWAGTAQGLVRRARDASRFSAVAGLPDRRVRCLTFDRLGTAWVGMDSGALATIRPRGLYNLGAREGLADDAVSSLLRTRGGVVWAAGPAGLSRISDDGVRVLRAGHELPPGEPRVLAEAPDGAMWVGTAADGLLRIAGDRAQKLGRAEGLPDERVRLVFFAPDGALWVGTPGATLMRARPRVAGSNAVLDDARTYGPRDGLCNADAVAAAATAGGTLWFGSDGAGLARLDASGFRCFGRADGMRGEHVGAVLARGDDLWVGLRLDAGLMRVRGASFVGLAEDGGLPCDSIHQLADDGRGHLWIGCGGGISRVAFAALDAALAGRGRPPALYLNARHGMRNQEVAWGTQPSAAAMPDGSAWFATGLGAVVVPDPARPTEPPPRPVLEWATVDGRDVSPDQPFRVTGTRVRVDVGYTAPYSGFPVRLELRHRLFPRDAAWTGSNDRVARLIDVPPGRYQMQVQARAYAAWSEPATLSFEIVPPFHRRPAFLGAMALLAALLLYGGHRARVRQMAARHAAVEAERTRIARELHDGLGQGLAATGYLLQAVEDRLPAGGDEPRALIEQARAILEHSYDQARRAIVDLRESDARPGPLELDVRAVVEAQGALFAAAGVGLQLDCEGNPRDDAPTVRRETAGIVQEALTNALRHARATKVHVRIERTVDGTRASVTDDGVGLPAGGPPPSRFGIVGMRERAQRIRATLTLSPRAGGGTQVLLEIPGARAVGKKVS